MKKRLKDITDTIDDEYKEIWDTCCDHGKLGLSLLQNSDVDKVHFVDCVPGIMNVLKSKLETRGLLESSRIELHTMSAEEIKLSDAKSLICICGVGGETAVEIIQGLLKNNSLTNHDLILCVQYKTPILRKFLIASGFRVQKEKLCFEGKWAHEIMNISLGRGQEIDLIGKKMFDLTDSRHIGYISKSIKHYEKKSLVDSAYTEVLNLYKALNLK